MTDDLLKKLTPEAQAVAEELRRKVLREVKRGLPLPEFVTRARAILKRYEPLLAQTLSDALLASWLLGAREVGRRVEDLPPEPPGPLAPPSPEDAPIELPLVREAVRDLTERRLLTRPEFDRLEAEAVREAFTVARVASLETLGRIQQAAVEAVGTGGTLEDFAAVVEALDGAPLSPGHVETVFRTNVMTAYTQGMTAILADPLVGDEFPYLAYEPVHDARARKEHRALETMGLNGTNVYRRDDPFWDLFLPPWDYGCRCAIIPLSVEDAAVRGVAEAVEWLRTGIPPARPQFVKLPDFRPPEGWGRPRLQGVA